MYCSAARGEGFGEAIDRFLVLWAAGATVMDEANLFCGEQKAAGARLCDLRHLVF